MHKKAQIKRRKDFKRTTIYSTPKRWTTKFLSLLIATGAIGLTCTTAYKFLVGDIGLNFVKPEGRHYRFEISNDTPVDQVINSFTITYPPQKPFAISTRDIYAKVLGNGKIDIPGGNLSTIPVLEYSEANGLVIPSGKTQTLFLPPTSSRNYLQLEASLFEINYETQPQTKPLRYVDSILKHLGFRHDIIKQRYFVTDNLWIKTNAQTVEDAIQIACRNDDSIKICNSK